MEIVRKVIHIGGVSTIVLAQVLGKPGLSLIVLATTGLYIISEYLRLHKKHLPIITRVTELASRKDEASNWILNPVTYAIGIVIALNLFPEPINYATIAVLTIGDGFASVVGEKSARHPIPYNSDKTVEGSTTFFVASFISTLMFVNPLLALLGSIMGTIVESLPTRYWENVLIPVTSGICMSAQLLFK